MVTYLLHCNQLWIWISVIASYCCQKQKIKHKNKQMPPISGDNKGLRDIELKLSALWATFILLEVSIQAAKGEKQSKVLPSCKAYRQEH